MTNPAAASPLTSAPAGALPGTWNLARGRALTLRPATDGILRVAHGRLWATRDGPHGGRPGDAGDHILEAGRAMYVRAGQRVVIEAWNVEGASHFAWDPVFAPARSRVARRRVNLSAVVQPLAELRLATAQVLHALGALARGVVHVAWDLLRGGSRALPGRRPHGCAG